MSISSHCVYLNTPVGGGGVRLPCFVLFWLIQKLLQHSNNFNLQTTCQSIKSHQNTKIPFSPIVHKINSILPPHKPHLLPSILHLTNYTRPPLNCLNSTHTSPQAYITILILSIHTIHTYMILYYINVYLYILLVYLYIHMIFTCITSIL